MNEKKQALKTLIDRVVTERDEFVTQGFSGGDKDLPDLRKFMEVLTTSDALDVLQAAMRDAEYQASGEVELTRDRPSITVGLMDVRAADNITVTFDFDRDGYVIRQDRTTDKNGHIETLVEKEEAGFVPAWNMEDSNEDR